MAAKVNLYEELYVDLLNDRGLDCIWQRATVCYCLSKDSGQPDFTCKTCRGSGYRYLQGKKIRVAATSFVSKYEMSNVMLRQPGTAYITTQAIDIMGFRDRLLFSDFKCKFSEVVRFSKEEYGSGVSSQTYREIKEVIFLGDDKFEYEVGVDFEVSEDRYHLRWKNLEFLEELEGKSMSILYYTTPSYLVDDLIHELRGTISDRKSLGVETFRELPKQYKIVREDFIYGVKTPEPVEIEIEPEGEIV